MNQSGEIVSTTLSNGHTADIKMVEQLVAGLKAKLYANQGLLKRTYNLVTTKTRSIAGYFVGIMHH